MFRPAFTAVCDACAKATMWVKANRMGEEEGRVAAVKGYRCTECDSFERKVLDSRGRIQSRD